MTLCRTGGSSARSPAGHRDRTIEMRGDRDLLEDVVGPPALIHPVGNKVRMEPSACSLRT